MNRNRTLIALCIAILVGLAASYFVYTQMQQVAVAKPIVMKRVVVAAMPLPLGTRLEEPHLSTIPWPDTDPIPGMFTSTEDVVNRALITDVVENEPILEAKLAQEEGGAGLTVTIPEGMRALSVAVNEVVAVAGFVIPGTMVDVLVTGDASGGGGQSLTRTILENIRVLAAGQKIERDKDGQPQKVPVITLLLTPEQASILTMASTEGRIQLSLRNTIDTKRVSPPLVLRSSLFSVPPPPRPAPGPRPVARRAEPVPEAPPKPQPFVVEVLRGNERKSETFATTP
jgi:pilus assembly protein CpaB